MFAVIINSPIREIITIPDICKFIIPVTLNIFDDDVHDKIVYSLNHQNITDYTVIGYVPPGPTPVPSPYLPVDSNCVLYHAYWDGTCVDHSRYGNNGIPTGGYIFVPTGIQLDGQDETGIGAAGVDLGDSFSHETWSNINTSTGVLASQGTPPYFNWITAFLSNSFAANYQVDLKLTYPSTDPNYSPGSFYHSVFTFKFSDTPSCHIYINGEEETINILQFDIPEITADQPILIGNVSGGPGLGLHGIIGETRIWKKILTQSDVTRIFNATKSRYGR